MNNSTYFYSKLEKEKVHCLNSKQLNIDYSISRTPIVDVAIFKKKYSSDIKEKEAVCEAYAHYMVDEFSPLKDTKRRNDYRAKKFKILTLVPLEKIKELAVYNYDNHTLADELGISLELLNEAYTYYNSIGKI